MDGKHTDSVTDINIQTDTSKVREVSIKKIILKKFETDSKTDGRRNKHAY